MLPTNLPTHVPIHLPIHLLPTHDSPWQLQLEGAGVGRRKLAVVIVVSNARNGEPLLELLPGDIAQLTNMKIVLAGSN